MKDDHATAWWRDAAAEFGPRIMDCTLRGASNWDAVLANGRWDLNRVFEATRLSAGPTLSVLEIGCGMGRLSFALAEQFGCVLGLDVSPTLIAEATRRNDRANLFFGVADGRRIRPAEAREWDLVFSLEVFAYLSRDTVISYVRDAYALLRPGGRLVFQTNCAPIRFRTRVSFVFRSCLHACGIRDWRGWPTAPGFRRTAHTVAFLRDTVTGAGFRLDRVVDKNPRDTWLIATKPDDATGGPAP